MSDLEITEGIEYCRVPLDVFRAIESAGSRRRSQQLALAYIETFLLGEPLEPVTKSVRPIFEALRGPADRYRGAILRNAKRRRRADETMSPEPKPDGHRPDYSTEYPPEYNTDNDASTRACDTEYHAAYDASTQYVTAEIPAKTSVLNMEPPPIDDEPITTTNTNTSTNKEDGKPGVYVQPSPASDESGPYSERRAEIVAYLNEVTGAHYRPNSSATKRHVDARLREGYSVEDFKKVIDRKADEWLHDSKMRAYLRPSTLFGPKFEDYLNVADMAGKRGYDFGSWDY